MKVPFKWIKEFVDIDVDIREFCEIMTLSGTKVEGFNYLGENIEGVVTGKITSLKKHEDSDHLLIAQVDVGDKTVQIVTGAPNVEQGQVVPVALDGARLPKGLNIKKSKLRGVMSEGMLCSIDELDLTSNDYPDASKNGIWVLEPDTSLGKDIREYAGLDDYVIEFEITPNRPDCYSVRGIINEASGVLRSPIKKAEYSLKKEGAKKVEDYASVEISDFDLCPRYCGRIITDVLIQPSPDWMRERLRNSGIRPINNIVDITNYVLLEMGQPMHAFDLNYLEGAHINVRRAFENEKVVTIDEKERALDSSMLVIADKNKTVAVAGVMGAMNSEVKQSTKTVLFESANFNSTSVRLTAKKLGMRTDSSGLFEKGLDPYNALDAINRACELVELLGAGKVVKGVIDVKQDLPEIREIEFDYQAINRLLGTQISEEKMVELLSAAGFKVDSNNLVTIPSYRGDVRIMADLAEEVARFYDYNNIVPSLNLGKSVTQGRLSHRQMVRSEIRKVMVASGLSEIMTYSFISPKVYDRLGLSNDSELRNYLTIKNPLGEDFSVMRTTTLPSMLKVISHNFNRNVEKGRFFEMAKTYHPKKESDKEDLEIETLVIGAYGDFDFYVLKGISENLFDALNISDYEFRTNKENPLYHLGRCADIFIGKDKVGEIGQVKYEVSDAFDSPKDSYALTLEVEALVKNTSFDKKFVALPRFPHSQRDLSLVVKKDISSLEITNIALESSLGILESINLFDMYTGSQIEKGYKSLSYSLTFRSLEKTLQEEEVNKAIDNIIKNLEDKLEAKIRS